MEILKPFWGIPEEAAKQLQIVDVNALKIVKGNSRKHSKKQVQDLVNSFKKHGYIFPVIITEDNRIICGEARYQAAKQLKMTKIPAVIIKNITDEQLRVFRILDDKMAEGTEWDFNILNSEFETILQCDYSIEDLGFTSIEYDSIINFSLDGAVDKKAKAKAKAEEDAAWLEANIPHRAQLGCLFRLGDHYVYCGDSLEPESYKIVMQGEKANEVIADPPYNCKIENFVSKTSKHRDFEMAAGEMSDEEFLEFIMKFLDNLVANSEQGSLHYIFMDWRNIHLVVQAGKKCYSKHKNILVWNKGVGGMGNLYRSQHELIALFQNGTAPPDAQQRESSDRHRTNVLDYAGIRATTSGAKDLLKLHPTVKPVAMLYDLILDASLKNDIVLDCFGGSGSTLLAAERAKRRARIIELDPRYVDVILWRWERETGKKAKLVNEK
jgi:DNA modification methylase